MPAILNEHLPDLQHYRILAWLAVWFSPLNHVEDVS